MKTLIVEDNLVSRLLLQRILSVYGQCEVAVNGREAIEAFRLAHDDRVPYSLVCMDIMMPEVSGHTALKEIRKLEEMWRIPREAGVKIFMITALGDTQNVMTAATNACDDYLLKPYEKRQLVDRLRAHQLI